MLLSLLPYLLPGLTLGLVPVGRADGETADRQVASDLTNLRVDTRYDGLSHCDPLANIFVINVAGPAGATRRAQAIAELEGVGIHDYVLSNAVVPQDVNYPEVFEAGESMRLKDGHPKLNRDDAALALSHQAVYKRVVAENRSCALVFEDDFRLIEPPTFKDRLSSLPLPAEYDWVKLDTGEFKGRKSHPPMALLNFPRKVHPGHGPCASAYIVSNAGARLLIRANTPLWNGSDGNMDALHIQYSAAADLLPLKIFYMWPPLAWQTDLSDEGGIKHVGEAGAGESY